MEQTAVEWLVEQLTVIYPRIEEMKLLTDKAKHMEKEQIVEAFYEGMKTNTFDPNMGRGVMYYNETYGETNSK